MTPYFLHPHALVESKKIGEGTKIWAFVHILKDALIGMNCNIGDGCFIESGAIVGDCVTIKNNICIWEGVTIENNVFLGPNVVFTNDYYPRSPRMEATKHRYDDKSWLIKTLVQEGSTIGANATIICGKTIGKYSMIGAGSVVTHDVPPYALMVGVPAKLIGYVCQCGLKLPKFKSVSSVKCSCGRIYRKDIHEIVEVKQ